MAGVNNNRVIVTQSFDRGSNKGSFSALSYFPIFSSEDNSGVPVYALFSPVTGLVLYSPITGLVLEREV